MSHAREITLKVNEQFLELFQNIRYRAYEESLQWQIKPLKIIYLISFSQDTIVKKILNLIKSANISIDLELKYVKNDFIA